ncbi:sensor histidine kinase [Winogradskyella jejuensis]|uniref:histidine kinase n=1 Tax=Winogradskyella jejuensis TaxID=1089305 RepID=A0A1M5URU2_9FLAO|nr:histidine kinase [Winogradskyella jejuensis]SHH65433.1 Signal transduction histidine kinase [Winogradskyella jejuensis]
MKTICNCFFLILFSIGFGQTTELYQKIYDNNEGFEIDFAQTLAFDDYGFLWIGGNNLDNRLIIAEKSKPPLQRFNGYSFDNIPLPNDITEDVLGVSQLFKRDNGSFYVVVKYANSYGLFELNPSTTEFKHISIHGKQQSFGLSHIFKYNNNNYILSQEGRIITLNILEKDNTLTPLFSFTSEENKFLVEAATQFIGFEDYCIISDDNFAIKYFDWNGNLLKVESSKPRKWIDETFISNNTNYIFKNNNSVLQEIDVATSTIKPVNNKPYLDNLHLNTYNDENNNHLIISFEDRELKLSILEGNTIKTKYKIPLRKCDGIKVVSKDLSQDIWLATDGKLHYFKFPTQNVKTYLRDHSIRAIKQLDSTNVIVSTEAKGWFNLNRKTDSVTPINTRLDDNNSSLNSSRNIFIEDNTIWTSSASNIIELGKTDYTLKKYRHYPVIALEQLNDSLLLYGTNGYNLMSFNKKTKAHIPLVSTDSLYIFDIAIKDQNNILCATDKGALIYDFENNTHQFYDASQFEDSFFLMTDYHKDYGFLLGSRSGHILNYDEKNKTFSKIYKDEFNAGIATIFPQENGLWINTFNGYVDFNLKDKSTKRYSDKDGFSNNEANRYSALKIGEQYFVGSIDGLNVFNPNDLKPLDENANLILLKANWYDENSETFKDNYDQNIFEKSKTIELPVENRALSLSFALKNIYARDNSYSFKYRLNDKNWVNLKQQNSIAFPNLAAGNYNLEIIASDFSGNQVGEPLLVKIKSREFFYKTWWFIVALSLAVIAVLLYFLRQFQLRKKLQDQFALDLIQSQEDERKRIARELHDSVSQQLTLIKRKAQSTEQTEISELTNNTLEEVRQISRGLFPPLLKQLGFTESVEQLALDIDETNAIFISTNIENVDALLTDDQSLHLYRFIQECINNILKHSEAKAFAITIEKQKSLILVQIKDNGKGFDVSSARIKNSLGLKTLEERIRFLNGELTIESKNNQGTTTTAKIPI